MNSFRFDRVCIAAQRTPLRELQGLNIAERALHGENQVNNWRRSYDIHSRLEKSIPPYGNDPR
jgi:bisphosphoglycerate-dependent phosphoglycerate mutase